MGSPSLRARDQAGFTLVELVVVLILLGVLSAIAMAKLSGDAAFEAMGYTKQVEALSRYAQKVAIAQRRPVFVLEDAGAVAASSSTNTGRRCAMATFCA